MLVCTRGFAGVLWICLEGNALLYKVIIPFLHFINGTVFLVSVVKISPAFVIGCSLQKLLLFKALIFIVRGQL